MNVLIPALCGLFAGTLSAWGIGGGTLLLLFMTLFLDVPQKTAQGINLLFFLPTAAAALWSHRKNGFLDTTVVRTAAPFGAAAAFVCAWLATAVETDLLRRPFGVLLLYIGLRMLYDSRKNAKKNEAA